MSAKDEDLAMVRKHASELSEHFNTVQIFVTKTEGTSTISVNHGEGNWFARLGHVSHWMEVQRGLAYLEAEEEDDV